MLTGRKVKAAEGERMGFVSRLVPAEDLDATVDELAATLAGKSAVVTRWGRSAFYRVDRHGRRGGPRLPPRHADRGHPHRRRRRGADRLRREAGAQVDAPVTTVGAEP